MLHTNEEDGEGNEEQEDMRNQVESIHEARIVQHAIFHTVGSAVVATKWQGPSAIQLLHMSPESVWKNKAPNQPTHRKPH